MRCSAIATVALALAAGSLVLVPLASKADGAQRSMPPALASFLTEEAHASLSDHEALLAGAPLGKLLDADPSKEIAVLGAVWVNASRRLYVEEVKNIEQFERDGAFRITKRTSDPPSEDDFAALTISDQDFEDLKSRIGDCVLKLDADAVQTLRARVDWRNPTAKADSHCAVPPVGPRVRQSISRRRQRQVGRPPRQGASHLRRRRTPFHDRAAAASRGRAA